MTTGTSKKYELKIERTLDAPVSRVWAALTEAERIPRWYAPGDEFTIEVHEWDCRVGGSYRVAMHHEQGQGYTCFGTFKEVEPEKRVSYTWAWEGQPPMDTLVTFALTSEGARTHLSFQHTGFPTEEARENHRKGWTGSLSRLPEVL
jgi:uncharacterized protein YndB with AHSA1/START domain